MVKELDSFTPTRKRYPWKRWTNGKVYLAKQGVDFTCTIQGFRNVLYGQAGARGLKVKVALKGDCVEFVFPAKKSKAKAKSA